MEWSGNLQGTRSSVVDVSNRGCREDGDATEDRPLCGAAGDLRL